MYVVVSSTTTHDPLSALLMMIERLAFNSVIVSISSLEMLNLGFLGFIRLSACSIFLSVPSTITLAWGEAMWIYLGTGVVVYSSS
eukprot:m.237927 g.237927  ORF g.237927 m.237927 type:complete len:85 (+) comp40152_c0_seq1:1853-2107(+)